MFRDTISSRFEKLPPNIKGAALLMAAALFFSLMVALIKLLGQNHHITQILLIRQVIITAIVAPMIWKNFPRALKSAHPYLQLVRIAFALVAMLLGFTAVVHLKLADATAISFAKSFFRYNFCSAHTQRKRRYAAVGGCGCWIYRGDDHAAPGNGCFFNLWVIRDYRFRLRRISHGHYSPAVAQRRTFDHFNLAGDWRRFGNADPWNLVLDSTNAI